VVTGVKRASGVGVGVPTWFPDRLQLTASEPIRKRKNARKQPLRFRSIVKNPVKTRFKIIYRVADGAQFPADSGSPTVLGHALQRAEAEALRYDWRPVLKEILRLCGNMHPIAGKPLVDEAKRFWRAR